MAQPAIVVDLIEHKERVMGNPQIEDGYVRIANELFDAILTSRLSGRQIKVLLAILRKTYGFNKKSDEIGLSQLSEMTNLARSHISVTIKELSAMNIIYLSGGHNARVISINKKYLSWELPETASTVTETVTVTEEVTVTETVTESVTETVNRVLPKREPQKTGFKDSNKDSVYARENPAISGTVKQKEKAKPDELPVPDFGGEAMQKSWADFVAHRAGMKKPLTALAAAKNINILREADAQGFCPVAMCDKAIASGWQGIFQPKLGDKRKGDPSEPIKTVGGMRVGKNWV